MRSAALWLFSALFVLIPPAASADENARPAKVSALLMQADAKAAALDYDGALAAYIEAVKGDRTLADLERIHRYVPAQFVAGSAPPPPPPPPPPGMPRQAGVWQQAVRTESRPELHIAALRQLLEIRPDHVQAAAELAGLLPDAEADAVAEQIMARRPNDPESYKLRSQLRFRAARYREGLGDLEHATTLGSTNAELFYTLGVASYELATKYGDFSEQEKRELLDRGIAALLRAESLRADYFESMVYRNLLLREQAKRETDPEMQRKLNEEADALRQRAMELIRSRRPKVPTADARAPFPTYTGPMASVWRQAFRVGGDVKAPVRMRNVDPVVPEEAQKARIAGIVILETLIDKTGAVIDARVLKPLPFGLDQAAIDAVKQWIFKPATLNGEPVDVIFNLTVNFRPD